MTEKDATAIFCYFHYRPQITDGKGNKESLSLTASVDLGNGYLAVAGTTNSKSYIITSKTGRANKLGGAKEDIVINW